MHVISVQAAGALSPPLVPGLHGLCIRRLCIHAASRTCIVIVEPWLLRGNPRFIASLPLAFRGRDMAWSSHDNLGMYGQPQWPCEYNGLMQYHMDSDDDTCDTYYASPPPEPDYETCPYMQGDPSPSGSRLPFLNWGPDDDVMSIDEAEPIHLPSSDDDFAPPFVNDEPIDWADSLGDPIIFTSGVSALKAEQSMEISNAIFGLLPLIFLSTMRTSPIGTLILAFVPRGANAIGRFIHKMDKKRGYHLAWHNITNAICLRHSIMLSVITRHFQTGLVHGDFPWLVEGIMCHYPCRLLGSRHNPVNRAPWTPVPPLSTGGVMRRCLAPL
jgi:hypothetical protein